MTKILLILGFAVASTWADCWWTGCQPNEWREKGCNQYDREDRGRERCMDKGKEGNKYRCCTREGGSKPPPLDQNLGPGEGFVTYEQFKSAVTSNSYPEPNHEQYNNFNSYVRNQARISSVQEAAMCLAQFLHESDGLRAKREYACEHNNCPGSYRDPKCDVHDQYYYGRGYIQLTHCENYRDASTAIFGDRRLVNDPDLVARNDTIAWRTSFWYWSVHVHDAPGVQQGRFGASTKAINGRIECASPGHHTVQKRFKIYEKVRIAFGLSGGGDPSGCA